MLGGGARWRRAESRYLYCTLDRDNWGPDQKYHVEPVGLFEYRSIPEEKMFGFKHFDC